MPSYKVTFDLGPLLDANQAIMQAVFPMLGQAVRAVAEEGAYRWKSAVMKARLWPDGEKMPYANSIQWHMNGVASAEISAAFPLAQEIETGRPAKDLKRMLQTSKKTRQFKDGTRYLIIPFRHNIPSPSGEGALARQMPAHVYSAAYSLTASRLLPPGSVNPAMRKSASGHLVAQHSYQWGGRLPAGLTPKLNPHHKTDIHAGMVRFDTSTPGKFGEKAAHSSSYLTFRVMSEKSSGWIVGARPGLYLAKKVADDLQPYLEFKLGKAVTLGELKKVL